MPVSMHLPILDISYKYNHAIHGFLSLLFSILFLRLIHAVACNGIWFLFMDMYYILLHRYATFIYSFNNWSICELFLLFNVKFCEYSCTRFCLDLYFYFSMVRIDGSCSNSMLTFLRSYPTVFQGGCISVLGLP